MWKGFRIKLEPKADKVHLHRTPKNSWVYLLFQIWKQKWLFLETGPFLRKSFSRKNWVGGWWRLDEVIEPSLQLVCDRAQGVVPVAPTPIEVEAYDIDHETSDQVTTGPHSVGSWVPANPWGLNTGVGAKVSSLSLHYGPIRPIHLPRGSGNLPVLR